jgi:pSer/pThr/pTyr-binding forkhead associated (FHA) protein
MDVALVMFMENGERRDFPLTKPRIVIGRNTECDLQLSLGVISRRHCELLLKNNHVLVRDLGSSNGTYVSNKRIQEAPVGAGETLMIGPVIFTVLINGAPAEIKPVLTILHGRKKKSERNSKPAGKDDTGSVDLDESAELEILAKGGSGTDLAVELEEPSKQRQGNP